MKISKKLAGDLCIIVSIILIVLGIVLWFNQKPNFSKYHSYAVVTDNGNIPLTDEQFQQIAQSYICEDTWEYRWEVHENGYQLFLYKSDDMSGDYVTMYTGVPYPMSYLCIGNRCFIFDSSKPIDIAEQIIEEAIEQSESEQKL